MFTTTKEQQSALNFIGYGIGIVITFAALNIVHSIDRLSEAIKKSNPATVASMECVAMSQEHPSKPLFTYLDKLWEDQRARYLNHGRAININALDDLDPVHDRRANLAGDNDYDGDLGREHSEHLRDNGIGGQQSIVAGTFVQIAAALPVIEAPSIVAEHPATEPAKTETS